MKEGGAVGVGREGRTEGKGVGAKEGVAVGVAVGVFVGECVGKKEGEKEGRWVGRGREGEAVGERIGAAVGTRSKVIAGLDPKIVDLYSFTITKHCPKLQAGFTTCGMPKSMRK